VVSYAAVKEVGGLKVERALLFYNGCLFVLDATAVFWHDGRQEHVWMFFDVWPMFTRVLFFDVFFDAFLVRFWCVFGAFLVRFWCVFGAFGKQQHDHRGTSAWLVARSGGVLGGGVHRV
jgi:hypothetical protein